MEKQMEDLQQKLKEQEKLASLGLLSAGIAHEIQNPLNFVINFSKISDKLLGDLTDIVEDNEDKLSDDDREEVEDIVADLKENMAKIVEHQHHTRYPTHLARQGQRIPAHRHMSSGEGIYMAVLSCHTCQQQEFQHCHPRELSGGITQVYGYSTGSESCSPQRDEQRLLCRMEEIRVSSCRLSARGQC